MLKKVRMLNVSEFGDGLEPIKKSKHWHWWRLVATFCNQSMWIFLKNNCFSYSGTINEEFYPSPRRIIVTFGNFYICIYSHCLCYRVIKWEKATFLFTILSQYLFLSWVIFTTHPESRQSNCKTSIRFFCFAQRAKMPLLIIEMIAPKPFHFPKTIFSIKRNYDAQLALFFREKHSCRALCKARARALIRRQWGFLRALSSPEITL